MLVPSHRIAAIARRGSPSGRSAASHSDRKVCFGSASDSTSRRRDLLAVREHDAGRPAVAPRRVRIAATPDAGADLGAGLARGVGHRLGHPPMPPRTKPHCRTPPSGSCEAWSCSSTNAVPPRRRAGQAVVDRVPAERGPDVGRCRTARTGSRSTEVVSRYSASASLRRLRSAVPASRRERRPGRAAAAHDRVGRGPVEGRHAAAARAGRARASSSGRASASRRECRRHASAAPSRSSSSSRCAPSGKQVERGPGRRSTRDAALDQPQVAPDRGAQHAQHVGAGRGAVARGELLGDAGAADDVAPFEHERAQAGAREVEGRDQAVVPAADDDRVVARSCHGSPRADDDHPQVADVGTGRAGDHQVAQRGRTPPPSRAAATRRSGRRRLRPRAPGSSPSTIRRRRRVPPSEPSLSTKTRARPAPARRAGLRRSRGRPPGWGRRPARPGRAAAVSVTTDSPPAPSSAHGAANGRSRRLDSTRHGGEHPADGRGLALDLRAEHVRRRARGRRTRRAIAAHACSPSVSSTVLMSMPVRSGECAAGSLEERADRGVDGIPQPAVAQHGDRLGDGRLVRRRWGR